MPDGKPQSVYAYHRCIIVGWRNRAEVFGIVGEAEAGLFDGVGGKGVEGAGV